MKILYVSTVIDTINGFLVPHIEMLINEGNEVHIATNLTKKVDERLLDMNVKIFDIKFNRSPLSIDNLMTFKNLRKVISAEKYDIVHTHTPIASAITRLVCKNIKNLKVIYTAHGFHFYDGAPKINWLLYYPIEKILSQYTDVLITINKEDYERGKNFKSRQVEFVPGVGIDLAYKEFRHIDVESLKKELNINKNDFVLLSVGELNGNKNHETVIKAMKKVGDKNIKYIICGAGNLLNYLTKLVTELNLEKQVYFLGYRNDISNILSLTDIFVFPSYREGLSRALMEAMAAGKPVIASKIRGNSDLIDDKKGGFLFNPSNNDELSKLIKTLLNNNDLRKKFSDYNVKKIEKFSLSIIIEEMKRIYENI